ncbi:MAG: SBBP repeat-containing protein [Bacteroidetes bacterium]|nr:SBBP repeat-containing protein [Bacteroidota bacterium]
MRRSPSTKPVLSKVEGLRGAGMLFTQNKGQIIDADKNLRPDVLYKGEGAGADIYLRKTGISYVYSNMAEIMHEVEERIEDMERLGQITPANKREKEDELKQKQILKVHRVDMDFAGCLPAGQAGNNNIQTVDEDEAEGMLNFYYPHCPQGVTDVKQYNRITCKDIYNNIDVRYYGDKQNGIKYDLIVQPHADPSQIKLKWSGAESIRVNHKGNLEIKTSVNEFYESIPKVYQIIDGEVVDVKAKYKLDMRCEMLDLREKNNSPKNSHISCLKSHIYEVTFELGTWNPELTLIIDPATWITYYGGNGDDWGVGVATDPLGNPVFNGNTSSTNFPLSPGATQIVFKGASDAYVVKFTPAGTRLFATYFGGSASDVAQGITADKNGDIYMTGGTQSTDFPLKTWFAVSFIQATIAGIGTSGTYRGDAYIVKFSTVGLLVWSTYYGGSEPDMGYNIITDASNNIIFCGGTMSPDFPTKNPYKAALAGGDAFIAKFNNKGVRQWATYYGGSNYEDAYGICVDQANNIFVSGSTASSNFPLVNPGGAFVQAWTAGINLYDAFIIKLNPSTGFPSWATCYGGPDNDGIFGSSIMIDLAGNIILCIQTASTTNIATPGAWQTTFGGGGNEGDAAIIKFNASGVRLWATYAGGNQSDCLFGAALDNSGNIYIVMEFEDNCAGTYPISSCAVQPNCGGSEDHSISKFGPDGKRLCATYLGGPGEEELEGLFGDYGIAILGNDLYVTCTSRGGHPVSAGAFQTIFSGGFGDAYMDKFCINLCESKVLGLNFSASATNICLNKPVSLSPTVSTSCDTSGYRYQWTFTGGTPVTSTDAKPVVTYPASGNYNVKLVLTTPCKKDSLTKNSYINVTTTSCSLTALAAGPNICPGNCTTVTSTGSSGTAPYTYNWNTSATTQNISACPVVNTTYTVTVTDATGATSTASTTVIILPGVNITTTADNVTCNGTNKGSANATPAGSTAPYAYLWNNGQTGAMATGLNTGNYTVTVTDSKGCTATQIATVPVPVPITITFNTSQRDVCPGMSNGFSGVVPLDGTSPYNYLWNTGSTSSIITNLATGTYIVTVTDAVGCSGTTSVNIGTYPSVALPMSSTPNNCTSGGIGTATVLPSGAPGGYIYSWSTGVVAFTTTLGGLKAGTYTVTVTDGNGCTASNSVAVAQGPPPSSAFNISPNKTLCLGSTVTFTDMSGLSNTNWQLYNYTINPTFTTSGSGNTFTYTFNTPPGIGTFTIVHNTVLNGCLSTTTDTVVVVNCPSGAPGVAALGGGCVTSGNCSKSLLATAAGGTSPYTYKWSTGATTSKIFPCATVNTTYTVTVTDAAGATNTTTTAIIIGPSAAFTKSQSGTICIGTTVNFTGATSSGATYSWTIGTPANVSGTTPNFSYSFLTAGNYSVNHTVSNGTCGDNVTDTVKVVNCSAPAVTATGSSICPGSCANVTANGVGGNTPYAYTWSTGASTQNISTCPVVNTTYTVTIRDAAGVTATSSAIVTINTGFTATTTSTNITCNGSTNGSASANPGSGTPPYIYNWSNGLGSGFQVSGLSAGTYTVTITDSKGCTATSSATIISPPAIAGQFTKGTANCTSCGCKEWVLVNATGGTSPYSYTWPGGYINRYKNSLCPGTYTINIKDKNGCSVNINLTAP